MLVNKTNIDAAFVVLNTLFNNAFDGAPTQWADTAMLVPSGSSQNDYSWLSRFPKMRLWIGDKKYSQLKSYNYSIVNDDWETTIEVDRNHIEDDILGVYRSQAQDAGFSARQFPDENVSALKNSAFTGICFDGQYFYDTDHPVAGASVSNKGTAALSAATTAAAVASIGAAITAITGFKDDEGRPLGLMPDTLEFPPALLATAKLLCENEKLQDESPNPYRGMLKLSMNPWLTSATAWFVHVTSRHLKPFIYQQRKAPVFVSMTDMASPDVFNRKKYKFGAEARAAFGYGLWQLSYGSTGAG